jgi:hypothetical protein
MAKVTITLQDDKEDGKISYRFESYPTIDLSKGTEGMTRAQQIALLTYTYMMKQMGVKKPSKVTVEKV